MDISPTRVDDSGDPRKMLQAFCDNGFDGDVDRAALALGRSVNEVRELLDNGGTIDEDLVIKIRGIAQERGIDIE